MMAKNVNERYQSAEDLVEDLRLARQGKKPSSAGGAVSKPGKPGKQFSLKKSGGSSTGSFKAVTSTGKALSASTGNIKRTMSSTGTNSAMDPHQLRLEKERKAKQQMILMLAGGFCIIVIAAAYLILTLSRKPAPKTPKTANGKLIVKHVAVGGGTPPKTSSKKFLEDAEAVLDFAKKSSGKDNEILMKMEAFFQKYPKAHTKDEEAKRSELMTIYVPLDEKRIKIAREKARAEYLKRLKDYQKWLVKKKQHDLEAARRAEEEKRLKELEARKLQVAREKANNNKERIAAYIKELDREKNTMRWLSLFYSSKHKYADAKQKFDSAIKESSRAAELYQPEAKKFTKWGNKMVKHVETASKVWKLMVNSGDKFKGMQIEIVPGILATIQKIEDGNITTRTLDKKSIMRPIESLPYKQFKRILVKAAGLSNLSDPEFHFLFCDAQFLAAKEFLPSGWEDEFAASSQIYANKKYQAIMGMDDPADRRKESQELMRRVGRAACIKAKKVFDEQE